MNIDPRIKEMLKAFPDNMPQIDKLREILQQTALLGLARHHFFQHAVFYGGTALRILHGLDRYSEDLDFSLLQPDREFDFTPFIEGMHREILSMGFDLEVKPRAKNVETGIWSAFLKGNTMSMLLSIQDRGFLKGIHPDQKIQIKLEIDTEPPLKHLPPVNKLVTNPLPFYVVTYQEPDLFAGKMHAALCRSWKNRIKGRDWYDLIWYIQKGIPVNLIHLEERMRQTEHLKQGEKLTKNELLDRLHQKIDEIDWELAKKDVALFIPDKTRLEIWSSTFFHDLLIHIKVLE
ncbi:MAG: nucleotidyl transferase AbiEii/AbiGii toxin family protein [Chlamydiia bacterium]|nr:nucleotidyl transferase AbiEii/AbiGii toxin family protein [Chlamydiia bacterium]